MKWFNNLRIRWKLLFSFAFVIMLTVVLAIVSYLSINNIDSEYTYLLEFPQKRLEFLRDVKEDFINMRRTAVTAVLQTGNESLVLDFSSQFNQAYEHANQKIDEYIKTNDNDMLRERSVLDTNNKTAETLRGLLTDYKAKAMEPAIALALEGDRETATGILSSAGTIMNEAGDIVTDLCTRAGNYLNDFSADITAQKDQSNLVFIILSLFIVIGSMAIAILMSRVLSNPLNRLMSLMCDLVKGNLNVNKTETSKDETGQLTQSVYNLIDIIMLLIKEMDNMSSEFDKGDIEANINTSLFEGSYRTVAESINSMMNSTVNEILIFMNCVKEFGNGNFDADIAKLPGKKEVMNETLDTLRHNLKSVSGDIGMLVNQASAGELSSRADINKYKGDWADLLDSLNRLMETIVAPINEAADVLRYVSAGNFDHKVDGNYKGDFLLIKNSINDTVTNISSYIYEISSVLSAMANNNDMDQSIDREYVGKFSEIKDALNNIIDKFNNVISDIYSAADQVAAGAKQISESSMTLAQGSSEQASSVEQLNAAILTINESTIQNANNALEAETLSSTSKNNALKGDQDMKNMLTSMDGINQSSNNIAQIISTIDDIAFQTNLLALNAAVEAARAGTHGKGFSVVADAVRDLAGKSMSASKEIAGLIEESIHIVEEGSQTADKTANALHTIVDGVEKVSGIITGIAHVSQQQAEAISQVTQGLSQITEVVQNNSATSEEAASASQELSSQAEIMRGLVSIFNLKRR